MRHIIFIIFFLNISLLYGVGVSAGTVIKSSASLSFSIEDELFNIKSNIVKNRVQQLLDVKISWMDTAPVTVSKGDKRRVLTFKVVNSGNGRDKFRLFSRKMNHKSDFYLSEKRLYLDSNNNLKFDKEDKRRKKFVLDADQEQLFFIVSDIDKMADVPIGSKSFVRIKVVSKTGGSGKRGTVFAKKGIGGVDAIDGVNGGVDKVEGIYELLSTNVLTTKSVSIDENRLITVLITVTIKGKGSARDVNIVDEIPNDTIYVKGSLSLNSKSLTDKKDSDRGRFKKRSSKTKAQILVDLGELKSSTKHTIKYNLRFK